MRLVLRAKPRLHGSRRGGISTSDRDPSNSTAENLAFLCLQHHDAYDSKRSQSKGFTPDELRRYKESLHRTFHDHVLDVADTAAAHSPATSLSAECRLILESLTEINRLAPPAWVVHDRFRYTGASGEDADLLYRSEMELIRLGQEWNRLTARLRELRYPGIIPGRIGWEYE